MRTARIISSAGACALALATASSALASDQTKTIQQTFPVASALCATASNGAALPTRVTVTSAQVMTACTTLQNAFAAQQSTLGSAQTTVRQALATEQSAVVAACPVPLTDAAACQAARETRNRSDRLATLTYRAALTQYRASVVADRAAFWTAVVGTQTDHQSTEQPRPEHRK